MNSFNDTPAKKICREWLNNNKQYPYPNKDENQYLLLDTGFSSSTLKSVLNKLRKELNLDKGKIYFRAIILNDWISEHVDYPFPTKKDIITMTTWMQIGEQTLKDEFAQQRNAFGITKTANYYRKKIIKSWLKEHKDYPFLSQKEIFKFAKKMNIEEEKFISLFSKSKKAFFGKKDKDQSVYQNDCIITWIKKREKLEILPFASNEDMQLMKKLHLTPEQFLKVLASANSPEVEQFFNDLVNSTSLTTTSTSKRNNDLIATSEFDEERPYKKQIIEDLKNNTEISKLSEHPTDDVEEDEETESFDMALVMDEHLDADEWPEPEFYQNYSKQDDEKVVDFENMFTQNNARQSEFGIFSQSDQDKSIEEIENLLQDEKIFSVKHKN